jgi:hydroxyacylglutathione hydrolase
LGNVKIKVLHTPGHTMESSTFLLIDEKGNEHAIFTGDTLFIGDVGRPDLAVKTDLSREDLAGHLYESIHSKILPLHDDIILYPGHGAGSACGKNLSKETVDTLGNQKKTNYALRTGITKEQFIKEVTDGLLPPPQYFPKNAVMNKMGYDSIEQVLQRGLQALDAETFEAVANETDALILDTRNAETFAKAFIPNAINIGIDGSFAPWVGALITDLKHAILLVADEGREEEIITRLSRVGYDNTIGFLKGGFATWLAAGKETDSISTIKPNEFATIYENGKTKLFDVRKTSEFEAEHIEGAESTPLDYINDYVAMYPKDKTFYLHCAGGYRSMIAASILKARGYSRVVDVLGGFSAMASTSLPKTNYVCPTTLNKA